MKLPICHLKSGFLLALSYRGFLLACPICCKNAIKQGLPLAHINRRFPLALSNQGSVGRLQMINSSRENPLAHRRLVSLSLYPLRRCGPSGTPACRPALPDATRSRLWPATTASCPPWCCPRPWRRTSSCATTAPPGTALAQAPPWSL